ncbi:MAG: CotH kinase family protein, partial [Lachnospiraceae bacterium]|nr:CotH kinase family protein [Lachnospiraceae bacterium]
AADTLCYALMILNSVSGMMYALFGGAVFSLQYNANLLLYVFCFVGAYGFSFVLGLFGLRKGAGGGRWLLFAFSGLWVILLAGISYDDYAKRHVVINEVCAHNLSLVLDGRGKSSDYIELYNPSFTSVSLDGWYLTDQEELSENARLKQMQIEPRSYLLLFANGSAGQSRDEESGEICFYLGFCLNEAGETLTLADSSGNTVDRVEVPPLAVDISYARQEDGRDTWSVVKNGSPGESNENLAAYVIPTLEAPAFSAAGGFYGQPFALALSAGQGQRIYYTTDGSEPTVESTLYTGPFVIEDGSGRENCYADIGGISRDGDYRPKDRIDKGTVVKAVAADGTGQVSETASAVYFVGFEEKAGYEDIMTLSLTVAPEDFFSEDRGIYMLGNDYQAWLVNYRNYRKQEAYREQGRSWDYASVIWRSFMANYTHADKTKERPVTAALFDAAGQLIGEERIGVRVRGGSSRNLRQKGFNFYTRKEYGEDPLGLCAKMLRTSGSIDTNVTMLRDVFNQSLVVDRKIETQPGEPCAVFLNGEYWGLYNLQSRFSAGYFEEKYGLSGDEVIVVKQDNRVSVGRDEDLALYQELVSYAEKTDLSEPEAYREIGRMMDIQSFIDHYCFEIYIANTDWPLNNLCCWRSRAEDGTEEYRDGRWRWGVYDTDESTGIYDDGMGTYESNPFSEEAHWFGTPLTTPLMSNLMENETFRQQFALTFMDMVNKNFAYQDVHDKLYEAAALYEAPMVKSYHRFNGGAYTSDTFWENIGVIDTFYEKRPDYVVPDFAEALGLSGETGEVVVQAVCVTDVSEMTDVSDLKPGSDGGMQTGEPGGMVLLNTIIPELKDGTWRGTYFTDYPVTATAVPAKGYRFVGWQGTYGSGGETVEAAVTKEGICLRAVFAPDQP